MSSGPERDPLALLPFEAEPVLLGRLARTARPGWAVAKSVLAGLLGCGLLLVVAAAMDDRLTPSRGPVIQQDDVALAFGVGAADLQPDFALSRDVTIALIVALQVVATVLLLPQWRRLAIFVSALARTGMLIPRAEDGARLVVHRANRFYRSLGELRWVVRAWPVLLSVLLFPVLLGPGNLFGSVAPESAGPDWTESAYDSWWASTDHIVGHLGLLVIATAALHFRILEGAVGAYSMFVFVRHRSAFRIAADPANGDGAYGWRPLGRVFSAMYWSLAVDGATLVLVWLVLNGSEFGLIGLVVVVFAAPAPQATVSAVVEAYNRRFGQHSVFRVERPACAGA